MPELADILVLFPAAILAGAINAVAGGGTFFIFPVLIMTGVPPIAANATSTMTVWPGTIASVFGYRHELKQLRDRVPQLLITSLIGGGLGAWILLKTPSSTFEFLIPWLLLAATLLFAFSGAITRNLRKNFAAIPKQGDRRRILSIGAQLVIATYGGYFGAGIGILMLALLGLMGMSNIHEMNALKTVLGSAINGIAVIVFVLGGAIWWPQAIIMMAGAVMGGYFGAHFARRLPHNYVRNFVVLYGLLISVYFFLHG